MENKTRAYTLTYYSLHDTVGNKHLYFAMVPGILAMLVKKGLPLNQDTIDNMKDALMDYFYDGVEPENWNEIQWNWWEKMSPNYFEIKPISDNPKPGYYNLDVRLKREFRREGLR